MEEIKVVIKNLGERLNASHRKEKHFYSQREISGEGGYITVRFYETTSRIYCCIWGNAKDVYFTGSGWAGGYGYNMESASMEEAFKACGIDLMGTLGASGECEKAINVVAEALGIAGVQHYAHG